MQRIIVENQSVYRKHVLWHAKLTVNDGRRPRYQNLHNCRFSKFERTKSAFSFPAV